MQCKQIAKDVQCPNEAEFDVFWPGQTTQQCREHEQKLQSLAMVMGFALESRPIVKAASS